MPADTAGITYYIGTFGGSHYLAALATVHLNPLFGSTMTYSYYRAPISDLVVANPRILPGIDVMDDPLADQVNWRRVTLSGQRVVDR